LDDVISSIQSSTQTQEDKIASLETFHQNSEQFITDTVHIDEDVADLVKQRKDEFYEKYSYLKPECEKSNWEKFCDGLASVGEWCKEHWKLIVTVVLVVAAIVVIVFFPAAAPLLLAIAKGILIGAAVGGAVGGTISHLQGGSFWEGFENGAFSGAIAGAISGGMGFIMSSGGPVALTLGQTLLIGGVSGMGTSLIGELGDKFIKGADISWGQMFVNMAISGTLGAAFAGIGYGILKGFAALKMKVSNLSSGGTTQSTSFADSMSPEDAIRYDNWMKLREAGLDQPKVNDVLLTNKPLRPDANTYLSDEYISNHLKLFENGVTKFLTGSHPSGMVGPPGGGFGMPSSMADDLLSQAGGDISVLENLLKLNPGDLGTNPIRIDVPNTGGNLKMPSGNEFGAWDGLWTPGGYTGGGVPEIVFDPIKESDCIIKNILENIKN
jgi:hypothetical protein